MNDPGIRGQRAAARLRKHPQSGAVITPSALRIRANKDTIFCKINKTPAPFFRLFLLIIVVFFIPLREMTRLFHTVNRTTFT